MNSKKIVDQYYLIFLLIFTQLVATDVKLPESTKVITPKRSHTTMIFIAGYNDLASFADRNLSQMVAVGSNNNNNIVVHADIKKLGQPKMAKRYYIERNKLLQCGPILTTSSGDANTLLDFINFSISNFPADGYNLIVWNHGTGAVEPYLKKAINTSELFSFNSETKLIELNRNIDFLEYINTKIGTINFVRGSCVDDSTGTYITNQQFGRVLDTACKQYLKGKKFDCIIFDACLMSMIEVITPILLANNGQGAAKFFIGSQEVVLGPGYDYVKIFKPFTGQNLNATEFAKHIVNSYAQVYGKITKDYTQSAIDLESVKLLENNINIIATILIEGLNKQKNKSVKKMIATCTAKGVCTSFEEKTYKDISDLFTNFLNRINMIELTTTIDTQNYKNKLSQELQNGINLISRCVIENKAGDNLKRAKGISIYLPDQKIHPSYSSTDFAVFNKWGEFLVKYVTN